MGDGSDWLDLADAVDALREQLAEAQYRAADSTIRFAISEITMQFGVELVRSARGDGGLRFGVVSVGVAGEHARHATHTITLKLAAHTDAGGGVDVSDDEP
jgi:Trypsin-co-occurring domain 2